MWANHTWTAFIKTAEHALNLLFYLLLIILICYDESSCAWYRANLPLFMAKLYQIFSPFLCPFPGQITQWNLMFHGTNDPPQKSDPPRVGKKKTVNDLVHNSLENSQWGFITQDVSVDGLLQLPACLPLVIDREVEADRNHLITKFTLLFLQTGDRCRRAFRCTANWWRWTHDEFLMSKIFRFR